MRTVGPNSLDIPILPYQPSLPWGLVSLSWAQGKRGCGSNDDGMERVQLRGSFGAGASPAASGLPIPTTCSSTFQPPPSDHLADPAARAWGQPPAQDAPSRKARQSRPLLEVRVALRKGDLAHRCWRASATTPVPMPRSSPSASARSSGTATDAQRRCVKLPFTRTILTFSAHHT